MTESTPSHLQPDAELQSYISETQAACEKDYNENYGEASKGKGSSTSLEDSPEPTFRKPQYGDGVD